MTIPYVTRLYMQVSSAGSGVDVSQPFPPAPFAAVVTLVQYVPAQTMASATATASGFRQFSLYNRQGSASSGTGTPIIARAHLTSLSTTLANTVGQFGAGLLAKVASTVQLNSVTTSLTVAAGDILEWETLHSATSGVQEVGGEIVVTLSRI